MSISDKIRKMRNGQTLKTVLSYLVATLFCIIFDNVYAIFGHGVRSDAMTLMFLYPLVGGVLPFLILRFWIPWMEKTQNYRLAYNCYNSGIAVLTVRSMLEGVFEIAGTSSDILSIFWIAGGLFLFAGVTVFTLNQYKEKSQLRSKEQIQ